MSAVPFFDAEAIRRAVPPRRAVDAVTAALAGGLDPGAGVVRTAVRLAHGELLLMPAESTGHVGVKVLTVAPGNPGRGLPRINAVYVLFDSTTLRPVAQMDGAALTAVRTPAVTVAALRPVLDHRRGPLRLVVFGAGPQGRGHLETLAAHYDLECVDIVVASPRPGGDFLRSDSEQARRAVGRAHVVVCATTARRPLFDSRLLREDAVVAAIGSHEPDAREVDPAFCARATVIVEDTATALRECGEVVLAVEQGALDPDQLVPIARLVRGHHPPPAGAVLYKGSGMSWQDLVIARAVLTAQPADIGDERRGTT
jgi:ornithine cyclodeaminase